MRTIGLRTHVMFVVAGAIGVLAALGRPWYAAAPPPPPDNSSAFEVHGPLHATLAAMRRWLTDGAGVTGWDALGTSGEVLATACGIAALCAVLCFVPGLQRAVSEPMRYVSFVVVGVATWRLVDSPGPNDLLELRLGALVGFACSVMIWVSAQGVANAPSRQRVAPPRYTPPPPPPAFDAR
jgi:hypothetical protein